MVDKQGVLARLKEIVGGAHVVEGAEPLLRYSLDGKVPGVVVSPGTREEISSIVGWANQEKLTLLPMGNGTKMGMGAIPRQMDIVLLTHRLNRIIDRDCDNLTLSAEAGITLSEVQKILGSVGKGYFLPLDPPYTEKATLGGIVATNASGPQRFLYGTARDLIIGMKAVFPNGDLVAFGGKTVKNVSGYDLGKLLIGSMGSLGIISEMTFKLLPLPESGATLLVQFGSLEGIQNFIHDVIHSQLVPSSVEVLDAGALRKIAFSAPVPLNGRYTAAISLEGVAEGIDRQVADMSEMGKKRNALAIQTLKSDDHKNWWIAVRDLRQGLEKEYENLISLKSNFIVSKWAEMLGVHEKIARELGLNCAFTGHAGNGILYSFILIGKEGITNPRSILDLIARLTEEAVKNEGNLIVESSPVGIKEKVNVWGQPRSDLRIVRRLKEEIDPMGILNPGRFVGGL